jgi:DNA repair exonuclease SbcCD ATPase subunit
MANVFGIITAIILALSGWIASKNQAAYENTLADTESQKTVLVENQKKLKSKLAALASTVDRSEIETEIEQLQSEETAAQKANDDLKSQAEAMTAKIAANTTKLEEIREKVSKTGDLKALASRIRVTSAEIEELDQSIAEVEAKLANLAAQNNTAETRIGNAKTKLESYATGQSVASLKTSIRSIYSDWGFVTLASGNNAGVMTNSTLNVVRNDKVVAKLLVTAVESKVASATIVPDSLAAGDALAIGDRVVAAVKADKSAAN